MDASKLIILTLSPLRLLCGGARPSRTRAAAVGAIMIMCAALIPNLVTAAGASGADFKPIFLVAAPDLPDPVFQQSVILLLPPTEPPLVAGIIINTPTRIPLRELFPHLSALKDNPQTAYFGGPVDITEPSIAVRAAQPPDNAIQLFENVYLNTSPGSITALLGDPKSTKDMRLFLGRAQWTQPQLHSEILTGAWIVMPADAEQVFSPDPKRIWSVLVQRAHLREVTGKTCASAGLLRTALLLPFNPISFTASCLNPQGFGGRP